jgi:tetratricopeptide (TPR) repeat protein
MILLYRLAGSARTTAIVLAGLTVFYSVGTYQRSTVWASDLQLWQDTAEKSPQKVRPLMWLGRIYNERGQYALAIQALQKGLEFVEQGSDEHAHLLSNIGVAHAHMKDYESAIQSYQRAIAMVPDEPLFHAHLAVALIRVGRKLEGWQSFERAFQVMDEPQPEPHLLRGQEHFLEGRYLEAATDFRDAVRIRPGNPKATRNLAAAEEALRQLGLQ